VLIGASLQHAEWASLQVVSGIGFSQYEQFPELPGNWRFDFSRLISHDKYIRANKIRSSDEQPAPRTQLCQAVGERPALAGR
jgi:hypothetical protein